MADTTILLGDTLPSGVIPHSEEQESVRRILESRHVARAPLLSSFLSYICRRTLEEGAGRISEYEIGVNVFRRPADFRPREDNIVRTYARHLRKRLQEYYDTEGSSDAIRIEIPKGGYVPLFTRQTPPSPRHEGASAEAVEEPAGDTRVARPKIHLGIWVMALLLLAGYSLALYRFAVRQQQRPAAGEMQSPLHAMWSRLLTRDRDTLVVPSDVSFVILQQANHRVFSLSEYLDWYAERNADRHLAMAYLRDEPYTSVLNLHFVSDLERLPEAASERLTVRAAKDVRLDDVRDSNAILLGSNYSNPWDELFSQQLNFQFVNHPGENRYWIVNRAPARGEAGTYEAANSNHAHRTYAVIAFLPNPRRTGSVLLVEGIDAAGTQAATDMLFTSADLQPVLQRAMTAQGQLHSFEVLIEANTLDPDSHAISARVIATRMYPPQPA
jgi:hypothetical protein